VIAATLIVRQTEGMGYAAVRYLIAIVFMVGLFGQPTFFREERVSVVGELKYGQTSDKIDYTDKPRYRALWFDGQTGDAVDIKVTSINGQGMAILTDSQYKPIVSNFGSHVTAVLPPGAEPNPNRYYIIIQEERRRPATFTVALEKTSRDPKTAQADYLMCSEDSDCVAVPQEGCCHNGVKAAVNKDKIEAYKAANTCKIARPMCPQFIMDDKRVAKCNRTSHQCEMVDASSTPAAEPR